MALVGLLESLLTARLVDDVTDTDSDQTRQSCGQGAVARQSARSLWKLRHGRRGPGSLNKTPAAFSEAIEEGTDVPASVLNQTLSLFRTGAVKVLAYNEQTSGPKTEKVRTTGWWQQRIRRPQLTARRSGMAKTS